MAAPAKEQTLSERLEALVAQAQELIKEIDAQGAEAVEAAEKEVWAGLRRYTSAQEELGRLIRRERELKAEEEDLPIAHSRMLLEDDPDGAARVKDRHGEIRDELATISERLPQLEAELQAIAGPNVARLPESVHETAVEAALRGRLAPPALDAALAPLAKLDAGIRRPVASAFEVAKARARQHVGNMQNLASEVAHHPDVIAQRQRRRAQEDARSIHTAARSR